MLTDIIKLELKEVELEGADWICVAQDRDQLLAFMNVKIKLLVAERGADKSLARPGRKQATATEDSDMYPIYPICLIYYHNRRNVSTIYIYNKISIKRNILTIKHRKVDRIKDLSATR
jgi:hypothetical protein